MRDLRELRSGGSVLEPQPARALMDRVLASPSFLRSARLSAFLRYVCERALNGSVDEISEQQIGVRVFGRPASYNPSEDNIVRSQARRLRRKLDSYFETEGSVEPVRIRIAKGGYVPSFESQEPEAPVEVADEPRAGADGHSRTSRRVWSALAAIAVVGAIVLAGVRLNLTGETPSDHLWAALFSPDRSTLIVPADAALVLVQDLARKRVALTDYASGEYRLKFAEAGDVPQETLERIARRRYTGIVDVTLAARLLQRPESAADNSRIRYARDLDLGELKGANVVFLGAPHSNPWIELYERRLNFWLDLDIAQGEFVVRNRSPRQGEQALYVTKQADRRWPVWAVLSFLPNLEGSGHVMILAGASIAGTESAADFLLNDARLNEFLGRTPQRGNAPPHFEVLIETRSVDGAASQAQPIAWQFY